MNYLPLAIGSDYLVLRMASAAPGVPAGLSATAVGSSEIDLAWTDSAGATSYTVQRSPDGTTGWTTVGTPTAAAFADSGLAASTEYFYRVSAANGFGASAYSGVASATTATSGAPQAPHLLTATPLSSSAIQLDWIDGSGVGISGTYIEESPDGVSGWAQTLVTSFPPFTTTGRSQNTAYHFRCRIQRSSDNVFSGYSNVAGCVTWPSSVVIPAIPTGLAASAISPTRVDLTWTPGTGTTAIVERTDDGLAWREVGRALNASGSFSDTLAPPGFVLGYRLRALDAGGSTAPTSPVAATTSAATAVTIPGVPASLRALPQSDTEAWLDWQVSDELETGFAIEQSPHGANTWTTSRTVPARWTSCRVSGLSASTNYDFRIHASNGAGSSAVSGTASATTLGSGLVYSPTGRNPLNGWNPRLQASWEAAEAAWTSNPTSTYAAQLYGALKGQADFVGTSDEFGETAYLCAAILYQITGTTSYADKVISAFEHGNIHGSTVTYDAIFDWQATCSATGTTTTIPTTLTGTEVGIYPNGVADVFAGHKVTFDSGLNADTSVEGVIVRSFDSATGLITLKSALPHPPQAGDLFTIFHTFYWQGDNIRENFGDLTYAAEMVWPHADSAFKNRWINFINTFCDQVSGYLPSGSRATFDDTLWGAASSGDGTTFGDQDRTVTSVLGVATTEALATAQGNPRAVGRVAGNWFDLFGTTPFGGLDATGSDRTTARNAAKFLATTSRGGMWEESGWEYSNGTMALTAISNAILRAATDADHFPEFTQLSRDVARAFVNSLADGLKRLMCWGDNLNDADNDSNLLITGSRLATLFAAADGLTTLSPYVRDLLRVSFEAGNGFYYRLFMYLDPMGSLTDYTTLPTTYSSGTNPQLAALQYRDGWGADDATVSLLMYTIVNADHVIAWLGQVALNRKRERVFAPVRSYGGFGNTEQGANGVEINGLNASSEVRGPIVQEYGTAGEYAYQVGSEYGTSSALLGNPISVPTSVHERTRSVFGFGDGAGHVLILYDRVQAQDAKQLPNLASYPSATSAVVTGTSTPTTTTFSTNLTAGGTYTGGFYSILFRDGANAGSFAEIASQAGDVLTVTPALPFAPSVGDPVSFVTAELQQLYRDQGVAQAIIRCPVVPTLAGGSTSWTTPGGKLLGAPGGQLARVDHLLPDPFVRSVFDESVEAIYPTEIGHQVRIAPPGYPPDNIPAHYRFLNVLSVADDSGHQPVVALARSSSGESADGALVSRSGLPDRLVLFGSAHFDRTIRSGYTVSWTSVGASTLVHAADLDRAKSWTSNLDGAGAVTLVPSTAGVGRIAVTGSGSHTLVLVGT